MKVFLNVDVDFRKSAWAVCAVFFINDPSNNTKDLPNFNIEKDDSSFEGVNPKVEKSFFVDSNTRELKFNIIGVNEDSIFQKHENINFSQCFDLTKGNHIKVFLNFTKDGGMEAKSQIDWE